MRGSLNTPVFSPDGTHLIISATGTNTAGRISTDVAVINTSTATQIDNTRTLNGSLFGTPAFSTDGSHAIIETETTTNGASRGGLAPEHHVSS